MAQSAVARLTIISPPEILVGPAAQLATNGASAEFNVSARGTAPLSYQWFFGGAPIDDGDGPSLLIPSVGPEHAGSYRVVITNAYGAATSAPVTLTVVSPPTIVEAPVPVAVEPGQTAQFSVLASGTAPLRYRWYFEQTQLLPGTNSSVLDLPAVTLSDEGQYNVVVSNAYGSATSAPVRLTVIAPPVITGNPQDRTASNGDSVAFTVLAQGSAPLYYGWFFNGAPLTAASGPTYTIANVSITDAGLYSVLVTNEFGQAVTPQFRLTVRSAPVILVQPADQFVSRGASATFSVQGAADPPAEYQWFFGDTPLPGETGATLTIADVQAEDLGTYSVVLSNVLGTVVSRAAQLSMLEAPLILSQPQSVTIQSGSTAVFTADVRGEEPLSYQWFFNCSQPISGATGPTLTIPEVTVVNHGSYCVAISNSFGGVISQPAQLRILTQPKVLTVTRSGELFTFSFTTLPGMLYSVYYTDQTITSASVWSLLPKAYRREGDGASMSVEDPKANGGQRYYKVVIE
jgi:hypothetical protein